MTQGRSLDRAAVPLRGRALIEASAGTGKSYTLTALYLRLILGHGSIPMRDGPDGAGFTPREILVLTFTRAATAELRQSIRRRLAEAARVLADPRAVPVDDFLGELLATPEVSADRAAMARRCRTAARSMDQATIYTIHGFCQRALQRFAFAAGQRFALEVEPEPWRVREQAINDCWRRCVLPQGPAVLEALAANGIRTPAELWKTAKDAPISDDAVTAPLSAVIERHAAALRAVDAARQAATASLFAQRAELMAWLNEHRAALKNTYWTQSTIDALEDFRDAGRHDAKTAKVMEKFTPTGLWWRKGQEQPPPAQLSCLAKVADYLAVRARCGDDPLPVNDVLAAARAWILAEEARQLEARSRVNFDTMITGLRQALETPGGDQLAARLRDEWPCTLIDEFQDTDPDQYAIFQRMYEGVDPARFAWLMIGDPKQAIYGFRGADVQTYIRASRETTARYTLSTNYRAARGMVGATNALFGGSPLRGAALFGDDAILFEPVQAHDQAMSLSIDGAAPPAATIHYVDDASVYSTGDARALLARHFAQRVAALLDEAEAGRVIRRDDDGHPVPLTPQDVTFLVRDHRDAEALGDALQAVGVDSVFLSDKSNVYAEPEAPQLRALLRAMAQPQEAALLRAALAVPLLAYDEATLARLLEDETAWQAMLLKFRQLHETWARRGVLAAISRMLFELDVPARLDTDGERSLTNLLQLAELLQHASQTLDGMQALLGALDRRIADLRTGDDEATRIRLESERARVRIVTLHGAKGLEYPLVILPFACLAAKPLAVSSPDSDAIETNAAAGAAGRDEEMRLLYVGITRAKYACWLGLLQTRYGNAPAHQLETAPLGRLLFGNEHVDADEIDARLAALAEASRGTIAVERGEAPPAHHRPATREIPLRAPEVLPTRVPAYWGVTSYSGLVRGYDPRLFTADSERDESGTAAARGAEGIHAIPGGREFGTLMHALLEACFQPHFDRGDHGALTALVERQVTREPWRARRALIADWLHQIMHAPSPVGLDPFCLAELRQAKPESEFWLDAQSSGGQADLSALDHACDALLPDADGLRRPLDPRRVNGMLKGFIDLMFERDGRYYVADYKTNRLGDSAAAYAPEALRTALLDHRYDLQAVLYLQALHRLLGSRLAGYAPEKHLGGCLFLFLRGVGNASTHGVIQLRPTASQLAAVDAALGRPHGAVSA
ncbi:MAG TPA: exodeoxyribonuclease V subunit beta [Nevskiaceae bacterium]